MERRELLKMIAALTGGAVIGGELFLSVGCNNNTDVKTAAVANFTADQIAFLNEVAETILPATKTPGAKAANVGLFMTTMVNDCYEEADQKIFHEGMKKLDDACSEMHKHSFMDATPEQRTALLIQIDKDAAANRKKIEDSFPPLSMEEKHQMALQQNEMGRNPRAPKMRENPLYYFLQMKQLTLLGYFSSKEGATQALRYVPVPGKFDGCIDYKKGDKAWATS